MIFKEYREQTKRTLLDLGSPILNSIHMCLGMCSELYELIEAIEKDDIVNVAEELIDITWYASNYCNLRNIDILGLYSLMCETDVTPTINKEDAYQLLIVSISELQDYDKKEFAYNKIESREIREARVSAIGLVLYSVNILCFLMEIDPEQAMQNNIDKLRKRFPDKFNDFDANNRNLENERKELEK